MLNQKNNNPDSHPYMLIQVVDGGDTIVCS